MNQQLNTIEERKMKKESNINVKMFRIVGDVAPLVIVDYLDKDAQEHSGLLLLDSCSNENILSTDMLDSLGITCNDSGETSEVATAGDVIVKLKCAKFSFVFGGEQFQESFSLVDSNLPRVAGDIPIIGILGNIFMLKNQLVIDYSDFSVHTSDVSPENLSISDCDFFVPMGLGFEYYGLPVLPMIQGDKQIVTIADTGATHNVIAKQTIIDNGFECHFHNKKDTITGIGGIVEAEDATIGFTLLSLAEGGDQETLIPHKSDFKVIPHYLMTPSQEKCDRNGEQLPPVEAIISSSFMAKEGWVLDFGAEIIYRRKQSTLLKEAV